MRRLTPDELQSVRAALTSERGDALRRAFFELNLGLEVTVPDGLDFARELGWLDDQDRMSELALVIRDPLRELSLWLDREGVMASGDVVPLLQRHNYAGKRVLELGSGTGCNLMSLQGLDGTFIGLEPMLAYVQLSPTIAEMAGRPAPHLVTGFAESVPFADDSFDVALCYSSHQYMDIDRALAEMGRVLGHDGRIIIVGNSLRPFSAETIERFARTRDLGTLKYDLKAIGNTWSYQLIGRRAIGRSVNGTTGQPVYPSDRYMRRKLERLGFLVDTEHTTRLPTTETALVAVRRS